MNNTLAFKRKECLMSQMIWKTSIVGAVALAGLAGHAAGLTPSSYVQDGLVVQLDAIDNTGTGTHNASVTVWSAVKGGVSVTLQGSAAWTGRYLDTTPTGHTISGMPAYRRDSLTIETAINIISNGVAPGKTDGYPRIFANADNCTIHFTKSGTWGSFYMNQHDKRPSVTFRTGTVAAYSGSERYAIAVDGVQKDTSTYPAYTNLEKAAANWNLNGYSGYLHGHYYAFRYYDRMLSMEELKKNATIDKLRFWSYTFTGAGGETDWSAVSWTKPEGAAAAAPSTGTNAFVQIANAEVNVSAANNVGLAGLSLEDGATLDIADGAVAAVKILYVEGVAIQRGFYTGSGTGANVVSWLKGNGILKVAGVGHDDFPSIFLEPGTDGWFQFGTATGSYGSQATYAGANREYFIGEYVDWSKCCFPIGGNNKLRLVGYTLINSIPANTFSVVDISQATIVQLYTSQLFEDGTEASIPNNVILRYQPGTWEYDEASGRYYRMVGNSNPYVGNIHLLGTESRLRVSSDNGLKDEHFTGLFHGPGKLVYAAFGNRARFSGGFALNNWVGGFAPGCLLWIDSLAVTSRLEGLTFHSCNGSSGGINYIDNPTSYYRINGLYFGRHGSDETADHDVYFKFINANSKVGTDASTGNKLRAAGVIAVWGNNTISAGFVTNALHIVSDPKDFHVTSGWFGSAASVGYGNLAVGSMKKDSCLYMGTNVNVTVGTVSSGTRFDYDTFISDAVNGATLDITNSCDSTATVLARDLGTLPARISGFTGTVTLSDTSAKSYMMPIDMTQGTNVLYNATGCIGSGTLAGAPASGTINATFPTDVTLVKGEYALARFTSGGEALANWTVTLNGQAVAEQQVGKLKVSVVKDTTGLWLKVARSGLTIIFR